MWKIIKNVFMIIILLCIIGGSLYLYKTGNDVVKEASTRAQKEVTVMNAIDKLEDYRKEKNFSYSLLKQYELPNQTLWEISISKWGATETCSILEMHQNVSFSIKTDDYDKAIKLLNDNNITYETVRELK